MEVKSGGTRDSCTGKETCLLLSVQAELESGGARDSGTEKETCLLLCMQMALSCGITRDNSIEKETCLLLFVQTELKSGGARESDTGKETCLLLCVQTELTSGGVREGGKNQQLSISSFPYSLRFFCCFGGSFDHILHSRSQHNGILRQPSSLLKIVQRPLRQSHQQRQGDDFMFHLKLQLVPTTRPVRSPTFRVRCWLAAAARRTARNDLAERRETFQVPVA